MSVLGSCRSYTVADPREGPGAPPPPPHILRPNWGPKGWKKTLSSNRQLWRHNRWTVLLPLMQPFKGNLLESAITRYHSFLSFFQNKLWNCFCKSLWLWKLLRLKGLNKSKRKGAQWKKMKYYYLYRTSKTVENSNVCFPWDIIQHTP